MPRPPLQRLGAPLSCGAFAKSGPCAWLGISIDGPTLVAAALLLVASCAAIVLACVCLRVRWHVLATRRTLWILVVVVVCTGLISTWSPSTWPVPTAAEDHRCVRACDLVVSWCEENMGWLATRSKDFRRVWVYSKCGQPLPPELLDPVNNVAILAAPNQGSCDYVYLQHVVHHYTRLAPLTVFCKGGGQECYPDRVLRPRRPASCVLRPASCVLRPRPWRMVRSGAGQPAAVPATALRGDDSAAKVSE